MSVQTYVVCFYNEEGRRVREEYVFDVFAADQLMEEEEGRYANMVLMTEQESINERFQNK